MKTQLRKIFAPILSPFEAGDAPYTYAPSHRKITLAVGVLFMVLAAVSLYLTLVTQTFGALIPMLAFFAVGCTSLIVGSLGNDRAIAKIWGNR